MAGCSNIPADGFADGRASTSRTMSTSTTQRPSPTRNSTWQPTQGIVFAIPSASQKVPYPAISNNWRVKDAQDTNVKSSISTTASEIPESSKRGLPMLPFRPGEAVSHSLPKPLTLIDIPVEPYGDICSPEFAALGRDLPLTEAKQKTRRHFPGVEGQVRNDTSIIYEDGSTSGADSSVEVAIPSRGQKRATRLASLEEKKIQEEIYRNLKRKEMRGKRRECKNVKAEVFPNVVEVEKLYKEVEKLFQTLIDELDAMKKEMVARKETAMKRKADEQSRMVKAQQKPKEVRCQGKGKNVEAKQVPLLKPQPQEQKRPMEARFRNPFHDVHVKGFVRSGITRRKGQTGLGRRADLYGFSKRRKAKSPKDIYETTLWQLAKERPKLVKRNEEDGTKGSLEEHYTDAKYPYDRAEADSNDISDARDSYIMDYIKLKVPFEMVAKGFDNISETMRLLAEDTSFFPHVRSACADMYDEVKTMNSEMSWVGHHFRLVYRLRRDWTRLYRSSYVKLHFWRYEELARETKFAFTSLIRFRSRRNRNSFISPTQNNWQRFFAHHGFDKSFQEYLGTIQNRDAAAYGWKANVASFWKLGISMRRTIDAVSELCCYWHTKGLLVYGSGATTGDRTLGVSPRLLRNLRRNLMFRYREMGRSDQSLRAQLQVCSEAVRSASPSLAGTCPINVPDCEHHDFNGAIPNPSGQSSGGGGTLNLRPTTKLESQCAAATVDFEAVRSNNGDAEALDDVVTCTSLVYQIPEEVMRETMLASLSTGAAYWQYSLYQEGGDPSGDKVKVHYCTSKETTERIAKLFLDKEVIGFDIEWKPQAQVSEGIKKNVSLIQLASEERVALFHIARYSKGDTIDDLLAPSLKKIMESSDITKVGVSVKADCTRLRRFLGIEARGLFELSHLYKLIKHSAGDVKKINKLLVSLAQQVKEHLQLPMWKGDVRSSDWSQKLNYEQIKYAASDSYAGLRLYDVMESKRKTLKPTPPRPALAESNKPIILASGTTVATYDEGDELKDEKTSEDVSAHPADVEEMARDFLDIELEDSEIKPSTTSKSAARGSKKSPEITAAETWVVNWRSKLIDGYKPRAIPSQLRAYALWSELGKEVPEVAEILRDPPLQVTTVASYISEAIRLERLPFDDHRLDKVWKLLPARAPGRGWRSQGGK